MTVGVIGICYKWVIDVSTKFDPANASGSSLVMYIGMTWLKFQSQAHACIRRVS